MQNPIRFHNERLLREYLKSRFQAYDDTLPATASLQGIVDSLGLFELVMHLEATFGFHLPTEDFHPDRFATIERILQTIYEFTSKPVSTLD